MCCAPLLHLRVHHGSAVNTIVYSQPPDGVMRISANERPVKSGKIINLYGIISGFG
jgi:hypothetical protein